MNRRICLAIACLLVLFAQATFASRRLSLTYDEPIYVAVGYSDLTTGDVEWHGVIGHPPLVNLWTAWPLLLDSAHPDARTTPGWGTIDSLGFSRALIAQFDSVERLAFATRLPVIWLTLLLAAFVYRWSQKAWNGQAGLLALFFFVLDPHIIAHSQLDTTDMGVTALGFIASFAVALYLRSPSPRYYIAAGIAMGAALASKTSGLFFVGILCVVALLHALTRDGALRAARNPRIVGRWLAGLAGWIGLALLVLWAASLFEVRPLVAGSLPVPAASFWEGLPYQRDNVTVGQTVFLAGRLIQGGHWSYFPLALAVKTPLPTLIVLVLATVWALRYGAGPRWTAIPLLVVPLTYLVVSVVAALNIGYRHVLPVLPFFFVFGARLAGDRALATFRLPHRRWFGWVCALLAIWYAMGTVAVFPHYLAYFNELAGGPDGGYRFLADSSIDWGQGLIEFRRYVDEQSVSDIRLAAFSSLDPAIYGLAFDPLPPTERAPTALAGRFQPQPGMYAISVVPLQGLWLLDPDTYDWFRHREPVARVGHAMFVYDVQEPDPVPGWVAQCATPAPPLDAGQIAEGLRRSDLRLAEFDCEQSWLYPSGASGWFVLPGDDEPADWAEDRLSQIPLTFRQGDHWSHPATRIYLQAERPAGALPPQTGAYVAADGALEVVEAEGPVVDGPVSAEGLLTFLGYEIQDRPVLELRTYWQVERMPSRPLSLMAHLLSADGRSLAIGDGLGVPVAMWRTGDVIVQRHMLPLPGDAPSGRYWFQTGVYWLDTMDRWSILVGDRAVGDRLLIPWDLE